MERRMLILLVSVILISQAYATTYYVATSGSDSSAGTEQQPFKTVQKGVNMAQAGDTVIVKAGDYSSAIISSARSGTSQSPIIIKSVDGATIGVVILTHDYITISGFSITSDESLYPDGLVRVKGGHNTISNNYIYSSNTDNYEWSIAVYADGNDNLITNNTFDGKSGCPNSGKGRTSFFIPAEITGLRQTFSYNTFKDMVDVERVFEVNGVGHRIIGNTVYDICWYDYTNVHLDVFQTFATGSDVPRDIIVEGNYMHGVDGQIGNIEALDGDCSAMSWIFRNNIFEDISMEIFIHCPMEFYNNLFIRCATGNTGYPIQASYAGADVIVKNNAFIACGTGSNNGWYGGEAVGDYNYVSTSTYGAKSGFSETHGVNGGNPQFDMDYRIGATSVLKDKGTPISGFSIDKDGNARPQGSAWDIGPYEYGGSACSPSCTGRTCGDNGCGGSCGVCSSGQACSNGQCISSCVPSCAGKVCGDNGCGGSCGTCAPGQSCVSNQCISQGCTPSWQCTAWSSCTNNQRTRICTDSNICSQQKTEIEVCGITKIEAESGTLTAPFQIVSDSSVSGGRYIEAGLESGTAVYSYDISIAGSYKIIGRVFAENGGTDSFYFSIDNAPEDVWDFSPVAPPSDFNAWRDEELAKRGTGDAGSLQFDPYILNLAAGTHSLTLRGRELSAKLDYFYLLQTGACVHEADLDCSSCISQTELLKYIQKWKSGQVSLTDLMEAIRLWKQGC